MTSNRLIIGLFGLLLFSSIVSAYTDDGSAFYCTNCSDCTNALNNNTYNITYLNATISGAGATCIDNPNITGKTFDCNGHTISGTYVGYGIDMQGRHNASIIGCDIDAFNTGIRIADASSNITVDDCELVDNTADGVLVDSSDDIKILNSIGEDNSRGFRLRYSSNCYMDNDLAYWNNYGFEMYESDMNTINNSGAYDNDFYGVYLRVGSGNNSIWNTYSSDNWDSGFVIEDMTSTFNRIYDSNASGNTNDGFYANNNNWTWITNTRSTLNGRDGYRFDSSIWINLTNGTSYDNTGNGYSYNGGLGYLVAYSKAYDNGGYGLHAWGPTTINFLTFSDIYGNGLDGVFLEDGCNLHGLRNDSIYGNTGWGFHAKNSNYHIILDSFIYDNAGGGMLLDASDASNYTNLVLYNNSLANSYAISISNNSENNRFTDVLIYEETNYVYQEATAPSPNNFTNLTIGYGASVGLINWDFLSITDLYLNSTNVLLDPYFVSLDASTASEANASANVSIYAQSWYDVYKADGFPLTRDAIINGGYVYTPLAKSWANGILRFGVADFSGYAAKANCFYADTPDTIYNITDNLFGNKSDSICITINTSNVTIQCNGYSVTGTDAGTTYGIRTTATADNITILDCLVRNYTYGVRLDNTITDSSISNTTSYNNSVDGFFLGASVSYVNLTDCTAYDNTGDGFDFQGNNNIVLYGVAHDNVGSGYNSLGANNYTDTISYDNGGAGFATASASGEIFVNCTAYGNTLDGFHIAGGGERIYNSTAMDNDQYGFYFMAQNTLCSNCEAYGNDGGLYMSRNTTVNGATLYNNSNSGSGYEVYIATLVDEPTVLADVFIYDASKFIYKESTATQFNFTNLTIGYNNTIGLANWAFANISDLNLTLDNFIPDPEFISMNSSDSNAAQMNLSANLTIGTPTCFEVYPRVKAGFPQSAPDIRFNGSICPTCNLYSCISNVGQFDVPDWSGYALGPNITECMIINSSGNYHLNNNVEGAPIPFGNIYGLSNTCILIESSNVSFTCNGFNITNNGTANSVGIAVNASFGTPYMNITIMDCPGIYTYRAGIYTQNADYNRIQNSTAYNNTEAGFLILNGQGNNLTDNTASANGGGTIGFYLLGLGNNLLLNNTAYRTNTGFYVSVCSNNNFTDNWAYNNSFGFYMGSTNNQLWYNRAENNNQDGFHLRNADSCWLVNNTAWGNHDHGFYVDGDNLGSNNNWLINNTAYSNWDYGFYVHLNAGPSVDNNRLIDNIAYLNTHGYYLNGATNTNLTNNIAENNSQQGYAIQSSNNNYLIDNTAFNNSRYGFYLSQSSGNSLIGNFENYSRNTLAGYGFQLTSSSVNNVLNDNEAYDNYRYGFEILSNSNNLSNNTAAYNGFYGFAIASNLNRLLDNTAYLNGDGISLNTAASDNVLENNTARDNYRHGFFLWGNSANNNLTDNEAYNNTANGIHLTGASSNRVISNSVYDNTGNAIYAETSSDNNVFSGNDMHDNVGGGIRVRLSSGNEISDNTGYDNGDGGVFLFSTTGGTVINNTMHDNPFGIVFNQLASLPAFENNTAYNNSAGLVLYMTNGFDTTAGNQGNELYENSVGLYVFNSSNHVITRVLNLHTNGFEIYVNGTVDELTVEETNTPEEEYVTLVDGAAVTNLHLLYNYSDVNGRVSFPSLTATAASADVPLDNTNFLLEADFTSLNDSAQQDFNTTANITLNTTSCPVNVYSLAGFPQSRAEIIANGSIYSATFIDCSGTSAEFGVTSFSGYALDLVPPPPSGGGDGDGDECDDLDIDLVSRECPSNMITFRFVDDMDDPITGERIRVDGPVLPTQYYDTDSDGEISFAAWADGTYRVRVTTASDYCTDEYVLSYTLCPEEGCYDDEDCEYDEYCDLRTSTPGVCRDVECECGEIRDHRCDEYECCSDEDCSEGERCVDHECVGACEDDSGCADDEYCSDGSCLRVEGDCGYAENHTWYDYECCGDDDCPFGFVCQEFECVLYRIITNRTGFVGDSHDAYVLPEGQYTLGLIDPVGNRQTLVTDPAGRVTFILESEGQYSIFLLKDEGIAANVTVDALKRVIIPEERPTTLLDQLLNLCWILVILALLVIAYILYRRKKEEKAGYKYKK